MTSTTLGTRRPILTALAKAAAVVATIALGIQAVHFVEHVSSLATGLPIPARPPG